MMTFMGDVVLLNNKMTSCYKPQQPYIFNLEYVIPQAGRTPVPGKINLSSDVRNFEDIFGSAPTAVTVANNHALDFGADGFHDTAAQMHEDGISTIGDTAYWLNEDVCVLAYTQFNGSVDGFDQIAFSEEKAINEITNARQYGAKCVIVCIHWGIEHHPNHNRAQTNVAYKLIDHGADLIVGCHPHCIQPIEVYKGKYICYSLGNCLFSNFNLPSHYDGQGNPTSKYRLRFQSWNRKSLAIVFDEKEKKIVSVDELKQKRNTLHCVRRQTNINKFSPKPHVLANIMYTLRKYYLFFVSNSFVDGKLFDFDVLMRELKK